MFYFLVNDSLLNFDEIERFFKSAQEQMHRKTDQNVYGGWATFNGKLDHSSALKDDFQDSLLHKTLVEPVLLIISVAAHREVVLAIRGQCEREPKKPEVLKIDSRDRHGRVHQNVDYILSPGNLLFVDIENPLPWCERLAALLGC